MKRTVFYVGALLLAILIVAAVPTSGEEAIYDDVIRLHVLAASDSEEDQALKLQVRDAILAEYSERMAEAGEVEEAEECLLSLCRDIEATASSVVKEAGYAYTVRVEYGEEEYPTREYGEYAFPAGSYRSLRVVIGEGEGANWWCVLFPPLCLDMATEDAPEDDALAVGLSPEEYKVITGSEGGYRLKFKTLELLEGVFESRRK